MHLKPNIFPSLRKPLWWCCCWKCRLPEIRAMTAGFTSKPKTSKPSLCMAPKGFRPRLCLGCDRTELRERVKSPPLPMLNHQPEWVSPHTHHHHVPTAPACSLAYYLRGAASYTSPASSSLTQWRPLELCRPHCHVGSVPAPIPAPWVSLKSLSLQGLPPRRKLQFWLKRSFQPFIPLLFLSILARRVSST